MLRQLGTLLLSIVLSACLGLSAMPAQAIECDTLPHDTLRVSLITCDQGPDVYQLFGHSALRVERTGNDAIDWVFNYGMFSFSDDFVFKFTKGETDYLLGVYDFDDFIVDYVMRGSSVYEQELNLSHEEKEHLFDALCLNAAPQNRVYRYNFLYDNCATRPRDMIEASMALHNETISFAEVDTLHTFRQLIRHYAANYSWLTFGIDLALGRELDRKATWREHMFIPLLLQQACNDAVVTSNDSETRPLVLSKRVLYDSGIVPVNPPTPWYLSPLFVALLLLTATIVVTIYDVRKCKVSRWYDTIIGTLLFVASLIIYFLIFASEHPATDINIHALWLTPLAIIPAILPYIPRLQSIVRWYHIVNLVLLALFLIMVICKVQCIDVAVLPLIAVSALRSYNFIKCTKTKHCK